MSLKKSLGIYGQQSCQDSLSKDKQYPKRVGQSLSNSSAATKPSSLSSQTLKTTSRISLSPATTVNKRIKSYQTLQPNNNNNNNTLNAFNNKENKDQNSKLFMLVDQPQQENQQQQLSSSSSASSVSSASMIIDSKLFSNLTRQQQQHHQMLNNPNKNLQLQQLDPSSIPETKFKKSSSTSKSLSNNYGSLNAYFSGTSKTEPNVTRSQAENVRSLNGKETIANYYLTQKQMSSTPSYDQHAKTQSCQMSSSQLNTLSYAKDVHQSSNRKSCRYQDFTEQHCMMDEDDDNDYVKDQENNNWSFKNKNKSQVILSTEACTLPRSSYDQSSSSKGIRFTSLSDEESSSFRTSQGISCRYHPNKKGKYLARLDNNVDPCAVCSRCAVDLASKGIQIEKPGETAEIEMRRELKELLLDLGQRRDEDEGYVKELKTRKDEVSEFCREQVREIEERFLQAESVLINCKNKALESISNMREKLGLQLQEKEERTREWLNESSRMHCEILLHFDQIINSIELNSYRAIMQNYKDKTQSAQSYLEELRNTQMTLQKLNTSQQAKEEYTQAIESLFSMDQIKYSVIVSGNNSSISQNNNYKNPKTNEDEMQHKNNCKVEMSSERSSMCLQVSQPQEYQPRELFIDGCVENTLPFSAAQSLSLKSFQGNNTTAFYNNSDYPIPNNGFQSPDTSSRVNTIVQQSQQKQSKSFQNSQLPPRSSKVKTNSINDTPIVQRNSLAARITQDSKNSSQKILDLNNYPPTVKDWRISELPPSQESEGYQNDNSSKFFSLLKSNMEKLSQQQQQLCNQADEYQKNNVQGQTVSQVAKPQSFRTLFPEQNNQAPRQEQLQGEKLKLFQQCFAQFNHSQNRSSNQLSDELTQQQKKETNYIQEDMSPHSHNLSLSLQQSVEQYPQTISKETPTARSNLNVKYHGIIDKIHANQTKNSTFYSELLKRPIKMDQQMNQRQPAVSETLQQAQTSQDSVLGQQNQVLNGNNATSLTGQFSQFIAANFGNFNKIRQDDHNNLPQNTCESNEIQENNDQQLFYSINQKQSANQSYRKTLFQSPQFKSDCEDMLDEQEQMHEQGQQEKQYNNMQKRDSPRAILAEETGNDKNMKQTTRGNSICQISFNPNYVNDSLIDE